MLLRLSSLTTPLMELACIHMFVNANYSFGLKEFGHIYSRIMNPTVDVFEKVFSNTQDLADSSAWQR